MTNMLKQVGIIAAATLITVLGSKFLGLGFFGVSSLLGIVGLAVGATVLAFAGFAAVALAICVPAGFKNPGTLLQTVFGTVSGAFALWLIGVLFPGAVLVSGFGLVLVSFLNTMIVWMLAYGTRNVRTDQTFWPSKD